MVAVAADVCWSLRLPRWIRAKQNERTWVRVQTGSLVIFFACADVDMHK